MDLQVRLQYKQSEAEDWTKVDDKALRKKIQNRLAKRKSRKGEGKARTVNKRLPPIPPDDASPTTSPERTDLSPSNTLTNSLTLSSVGTRDTSIANTDEQLQTFMSIPGLFEHRFIRLTQYSLMRSLVRNAAILFLDFSTLMDDEALSPWTLSNPYAALAPLDLRPTSVQLCTPHHPFLDIMAPAAFRDNVLLACLEDEVVEQLCYELHVGSFTVWGEQPWNAMAWEVSQEFATSWWWLLDEGLVRTTNFWRGEREEPGLVLPEAGGGTVEELM